MIYGTNDISLATVCNTELKTNDILTVTRIFIEDKSEMPIRMKVRNKLAGTIPRTMYQRLTTELYFETR